jgi:hypothetical protein
MNMRILGKVGMRRGTQDAIVVVVRRDKRSTTGCVVRVTMMSTSR